MSTMQLVGDKGAPRGTGRLRAPDPRDRAFEVTPAVLRSAQRAIKAKARKLPWRLGPVLDQLKTSECTVYTAAHFLQAAPWLTVLNWVSATFTAHYRGAQARDEWPGSEPSYYGTSFRAVMKVLQSAGYIDSYWWITDTGNAIEHLRSLGGLGFGSDWFTLMDKPSAKGAYVEPGGDWRGGHEYFLRWYYPVSHYRYPDTFEFVNSWGPDWGDRGLFRMKRDSFVYLFESGGDLCAPMERRMVS